MKIHEFYRKYADMKEEDRYRIITTITYNPVTPFVIFKQLEDTRKQIRYFQKKEEELLRMADEMTYKS